MAASHEGRLPAFAQISEAKLGGTDVPDGAWIRISKKIHPDGLGFNATGESRFSDPDKQFGVVYFARELETSVAEVIIRDRKVGMLEPLMLGYDEAVYWWRAVFVANWRTLRVIDLRRLGLINFGIDTDVVRGRSQMSSRQLSKAIHLNKHDSFDGILYESRLSGGTCLAVYDRALSKLAIGDELGLEKMLDQLGEIYRGMNVIVDRRSGPAA
jgi:hypothetical protein